LHHFRIRSNGATGGAGFIGFTVDGGTETIISTNVPTVALQLALQVFTFTAASKTVEMDFVSYVAVNGRT
jgi:hypothetical protein